jgi:allantoin racemase
MHVMPSLPQLAEGLSMQHTNKESGTKVMRIKVIMPVIHDLFNETAKLEFRSYASGETEIHVSHLDKGTASIESHYDEVLAGPDILKKTQEAEQQGYDGVIIDCFGDPAVKAAREIVDIPVLGGFESAIHLAMLLAQKFSIVTVLPHVLPMLEDLINMSGTGIKLASLRYINMPVLDLQDSEKLKTALLKEMVEAVEKDGAHALILGCTGMMGLAAELYKELKNKGYDVPVIDPAAASMKMMELLVSLNLKPSKLTYMIPREKERNV